MLNQARRMAVALLAFFCISAFAVSGPGDRQVTDPKSIASVSHSAARPVPIDDLYYSRRVSSPAWSPDGRELVFTTDFTGRQNLWKVNADGGWPVQLLQSDDRQGNATFSPDGKWIVYSQDVGGHEIYDLYAVPSDGGQPINLTNTPHISEATALFSPDGSLLVISTKPESSPISDIAILDWKTRQIRALTTEKTPNRFWSPMAWSKDGRYIYANRNRADFADADIYRIEVASGRSENLTDHKGDIRYQVSSVSPDGKILLESNEKGGYQNVAIMDPAGKKLQWVTDTQWEGTAGYFSPDGKRFTYLINADGRSTLYVQEAGAGPAKKVPAPEGLTFSFGRPNAFSPDSTRLVLTHQDSQRPSDLWIYDVRTDKLTQLTRSALASLSPSSIPPSQIVHYKSFDGQMISAILRMPFNLKRDGSNPVVVLPHGGPTGQTNDSF